MPTYVYRCPRDGSEQLAIRLIVDRNSYPLCENCGGYMQRIVTPTYVVIK